MPQTARVCRNIAVIKTLLILARKITDAKTGDFNLRRTEIRGLKSVTTTFQAMLF